MRPHFAFVISIVVLLSSPACYSKAPEGKPLLVAGDLKLTEQEIERYSSEALDGSGEAAVKLGSYYEESSVDLDKALHWYLIGAENGDAAAQHDVFRFSEYSSDPAEKRRGIFWLRKSAAQGNKYSQDQLKVMDH